MPTHDAPLLDGDIRQSSTCGPTPPGRQGQLPLTEKMLLESPSGDLFGLTQNAGMGWKPASLLRKQFLILSTQGGIRADDGTRSRSGYHTGHWEVGLLVRAAAEELESSSGCPSPLLSATPATAARRGRPA